MTDQHLSGSSLCSVSDVLQIAYGRSDTSSLDYSTSDILSAIEDAEQEIFSRFGDSMKSQFFIEEDQTEYEFRPNNEKTYFIRQLVIDDPDNDDSGMSYQPSGSYTVNLNVNKITFSTTQASQWAKRYCYVDFIPYTWHLLAKNKAALNLLDGDAAVMTPGEGDVDNPRVARIARRISRIESDIMPYGAVGSYEEVDYDPRTYDRPYITQKRFR